MSILQPGQKPHHYRNDGFTKTSLCMQSIHANKKEEILRQQVNLLS